jgi:hypothetical protein
MINYFIDYSGQLHVYIQIQNRLQKSPSVLNLCHELMVILFDNINFKLPINSI